MVIPDYAAHLHVGLCASIIVRSERKRRRRILGEYSGSIKIVEGTWSEIGSRLGAALIP